MSCTRTGRIGSCSWPAHEDRQGCIGRGFAAAATFFGSAYLHQVRRALILVSHLAQRATARPQGRAGHGELGRPRPELWRLPVERGAIDGALRDRHHRRIRSAVPDALRPQQIRFVIDVAAWRHTLIWQPHMASRRASRTGRHRSSISCRRRGHGVGIDDQNVISN